MKAWVRKSFKVIPLVLLALVLTACGPFSKPTKHLSDPVPPSSAGTSPTAAPSSAGTSPTAAPSSAGTSPTAAPSSADTSPTAAPSSADTSPTTAPSPVSTGWACVTSEPTGTCPGANDYTAGSTNSNGYNTYLANNCWADPSCKQTLSANSFGNWQVSSTEPAGNGSVETAPEAQQQFNNWCSGSKTWSNLVPNGCPSSETDTPISALSQLTGSYAESTPHNSQTIAQWAWDNWLSNDAGYPDEVMVWVDNNGRCNSGSFGTQVHAPVIIGGQEWTPHRYPNSNEFIWSLDGPGGVGTCAQQASGTVDLLALLKWMQANGFAAPGATLSLLDGAFEICSTGGAPETFSVSSYSITARAA
jgi:hypothetical protein